MSKGAGNAESIASPILAEENIANNRREIVRAAGSVNNIYPVRRCVAMWGRVPRRDCPYPVQINELINVTVGDFDVLESFAENGRLAR